MAGYKIAAQENMQARQEGRRPSRIRSRPQEGQQSRSSLPSFSCASSDNEVRLSYHGNQAFNEGASCTARSNSPPTEPSARRFARRNSTSRTHHVDSTEEAQATRKNRR